jgi:hypothetical protein
MLRAMRTVFVTVLAAAWLFLDATLGTTAPQTKAGCDAQDRGEPPKLSADEAARVRQDALARAVVWVAPHQAPQTADLRGNPDCPPGRGDPLTCRFQPGKTGGDSPKFECLFESGEVLKVKYGPSAEVHTEVAATRLMHALGVGADRMYLVERLRCFGCPQDPYRMLRCISSPFEALSSQCADIYGERRAGKGVVVEVDYSRYTDFDLVAIERKAQGWPIEAPGKTGWAWSELDVLPGFDGVRVAAADGTRLPAAADTQRDERDALRLLAVFLNNWDNRADNQRLLCLDDRAPASGEGCRTPLAYMQDVGGTFGRVGGAKGERKLDVEGWRETPIWKDRASCRVNIRAPRLHGATFGEATISEGGRRLLAERLSALSEQQVRDLFEGARFADFEGASEASRDVGLWVRAFQEKVKQIASGAPCPAW